MLSFAKWSPDTVNLTVILHCTKSHYIKTHISVSNIGEVS